MRELVDITCGMSEFAARHLAGDMILLRWWQTLRKWTKDHFSVANHNYFNMPNTPKAVGLVVQLIPMADAS